MTTRAPYASGVERRISLVTLGVRDLARSKAFYAALGWVGQEVAETVFIQAGQLAVVLWSRAALAADAGVDDPAGPSPGDDAAVPPFGGIALAHNVRARSDVDTVMAAASGAGATVTRSAAETFYGGYAGWFRDPDGHLWEVAHNPGFTLTDDGALVVPNFGS